LENRLRPPSGRRAAEGRGKKIPRRQRFAGGFVGFLAGFLLIFRTINSPFGEVLKSIRENEPRAISLGYKPTSTSCWSSSFRARSRALPDR
jgi:ABC-type branched-subunit amino acid transport system permease subunit